MRERVEVAGRQDEVDPAAHGDGADPAVEVAVPGYEVEIEPLAVVPLAQDLDQLAGKSGAPVRGVGGHRAHETDGNSDAVDGERALAYPDVRHDPPVLDHDPQVPPVRGAQVPGVEGLHPALVGGPDERAVNELEQALVLGRLDGPRAFDHGWRVLIFVSSHPLALRSTCEMIRA